MRMIKPIAKSTEEKVLVCYATSTCTNGPPSLNYLKRKRIKRGKKRWILMNEWVFENEQAAVTTLQS